jgi:hypothetical protein
MKNTFEALNDPEIQLLKPNSLKGQKILIVMLWTYELNPEKENKKIMPGYLFESGIKNQPVDYLHPIKNRYCVETAVKKLGRYKTIDSSFRITSLNGKGEINVNFKSRQRRNSLSR